MNHKDLAKLTANALVSVVASKVTSNVIVNTTNADPDSIPVKTTSMVTGAVVATKAEPYTIKFVDRAFAWYENRKAQTII